MYIAARKREYERVRLSRDPAFKLRCRVKNAVYCALLRNGASKNGGSILDHLPYSMDELRVHLENLFEPWMNWDNWGIYNPNTWDDNNSKTWTWHIDHIVKQSDLKYDSFEHPNFLRCWSLENLRPYSSKTNIRENFKRL